MQKTAKNQKNDKSKGSPQPDSFQSEKGGTMVTGAKPAQSLFKDEWLMPVVVITVAIGVVLLATLFILFYFNMGE